MAVENLYSRAKGGRVRHAAPVQIEERHPISGGGALHGLAVAGEALGAGQLPWVAGAAGTNVIVGRTSVGVGGLAADFAATSVASGRSWRAAVGFVDVVCAAGVGMLAAVFAAGPAVGCAVAGSCWLPEDLGGRKILDDGLLAHIFHGPRSLLAQRRFDAAESWLAVGSRGFAAPPHSSHSLRAAYKPHRPC